MDPVTHTLTGAAMSRAGLRRFTPRATAALVLAANAPDVDVLVYAFGGEYDALAFRRGWTHGPLALIVLPFLVAGLVLAWDRLALRRGGDGSPARAAPLVALAFLGVLSHPALDWLNNYGIRLLMPFSDRWFYGDAVFIIDPWAWLGLGAAVFLAGRGTAGPPWGWILAAAAATALMLAAPVPAAARVAWIAGIAAVATLRFTGRGRSRGDGRTLAAAAASAVALYVLALVAADAAETRIVRAAAAKQGIARVRDVMVAPLPADPFGGHIVVVTPDAYHTGTFRWLDSPRVRFDRRVDRGPPELLARAVALSDEARGFLVWARYPFARLEATAGGRFILVSDVRYARERRAGGLAGLRVPLTGKEGETP